MESKGSFSLKKEKTKARKITRQGAHIVAQLVEGMQNKHKGLRSIINIAKPGHCGACL